MTNSYFKNLNTAGIPFMETREKANINSLVNGGVYHIMPDFGFIKSKINTGADYAVFCVKEDTEHFYFGGVAVTNTLHTIAADNMRDELAMQPVTFETFKSSFGTDGVAIRFAE